MATTALAVTLTGGHADGPAAGRSASADPLAARGWKVTSGAAPGYVDERACGACHPDLQASFHEVGMGRSFARPADAARIERFGERFFHQASGRTYEIVETGGALLFRGWQLDADGEPTNLFEQPVDWVLGSGHTSRVYLYGNPAGELYQLPLAWYSQEGGWGMAPGFDNRFHQGVTRRVRRECMFCHNGYPDVPAGSDEGYWTAQWFPAALPSGIGCQRCHGPGAEHSRLALAGAEPAVVVAAILDLGELPPERREEICFQCHLQPSVVLPGTRRFARPDYSFRPGEPLADYLVQLDVREEERSPAERFEINHHAYRLLQSPCRQASGAELSCLTCHDPHRKVPPAERAAHTRRACLSCHPADACTREHAPPGTASSAAETADDCATCHMPRRRTQDVVRVVMTDHRIGRPVAGDLTAPLAEREPLLTDVLHFDPATAPGGGMGDIYRLVALVRSVPSSEALDLLAARLEAAAPAELDPWLDLAQGLLRRGRAAEGGALIERLLEPRPDHALLRGWLALALAGAGELERASAAAERALAATPKRPESHFNMGILLVASGRQAAAEPHLRRAVELRPNFAAAWFHLGNAYAARESWQEAAEAFRAALSIEPADQRSYLALARSLAASGDLAAARRTLRNGTGTVAQPEPLLAELAALAAPRPGR